MNASGQLYALTPASQAAAIATALGFGRERHSGDTWTAYCPVHESDGAGNPDLDIKVKEGRVLLHCQSRGCDNAAIIAELKARGLWPDRAERRRAPRLTLAEFSAAKKLTVEFLLAHDVAEATSRNQPVLHFRYRREDGSLAPRWRVRIAMDGLNKFFWDKKSAEPISAYGLNRLPAVRADEKGYLVLVEGESDALTLWHHDIPALAFPGNTTAPKLLTPRLLDGIPKLIVSVEPGEAGKKFFDDILGRLKLLRWAGKIRILRWTDSKDPSALHVKEPSRFVEEFQRLVKASEMIELGSGDPAPVIVNATAYLPETTREAWDALRAANDTRAIPRIYKYGSLLVRVETDGPTPTMRTLREPEMRGEMVRAALFLKDGVEPITPTRHQVEDVLQVENKPVPALRRVTAVPIFGRDGSLIDTPGLRRGDGVLYLPARDLVVPPVAENPSLEECILAYNLIAEMIKGFPFATGDDGADHAHAIALLLLPFVREMIDGPTPIHLFEAPVARTGKGLLAEQVLYVGLGNGYSHLGPPSEVAYQFVQSINTGLLAGSQAFLFDNIVAFVKSPFLAKAVTSPFWSERILGGNSSLIVDPLMVLWVMCANNPQLDTDIQGRTIRIRLDAKSPNPEDRPFDVDLPAWVKANRGKLIGACITMVRHWLAIGSPKPRAKPLGRFENWTRVIGGIIEAAGIEGFLKLRPSDVKDSGANSEGVAWAEFVAQWWDSFAETEQSVGGLLPIARKIEGFWLGESDKEKGEQNVLGRALHRHRDWIISPMQPDDAATQRRPDSLRITYTQTANRRGGWKLQRPAKPENKGEQNEQRSI